MPKQALNKSITAKKLHRRTMNALPEPEVTIPFGSIVDKIKLERDYVTFEYINEPYICPRDMFMSAVPNLREVAEPDATPSTPAPAFTASTPAPAAEPAALQFEALSSSVRLSRAKVPGGWLLATSQGGITFYPDAAHAWDGTSVE